MVLPKATSDRLSQDSKKWNSRLRNPRWPQGLFLFVLGLAAGAIVNRTPPSTIAVTKTSSSSSSPEIMDIDITAIEKCSAKQKKDYNVAMKDIHSKNPYANFAPSMYGIKGPDLSGWGLDKAHEKLFNVVKPKFMVEVGSWKGLSATNFAKMMHKTHGDNDTTCPMLICVDTWLGTTIAWENKDMENPGSGNTLYLRNGYPSVYYQFLYNVIDQGVSDIIVPLPLPSVMGAIFLNRAGALPDAIYIDGCHDETCVNEDLEEWFPLLKENGVLFGDDYSRQGVQNAVKNYCTDSNNCNLDQKLTTVRTFVLRKGTKKDGATI